MMNTLKKHIKILEALRELLVANNPNLQVSEELAGNPTQVMGGGYDRDGKLVGLPITTEGDIHDFVEHLRKFREGITNDVDYNEALKNANIFFEKPREIPLSTAFKNIVQTKDSFSDLHGRDSVIVGPINLKTFLMLPSSYSEFLQATEAYLSRNSKKTLYMPQLRQK
ncbi:MAG: hypothetical protein SFT90_02170 [Rickettsiales bacterium]|nr:hypothetical protein [Rickettsiales bacterium]